MAFPAMATMIEPFRKGTSFCDWVERLAYCFQANEITDQMKKAHLITLGGPVMYSELKLLYPNGTLEAASYADIVSKLKARLDKVEPDVIQRAQFNSRIRQPGETLEDFVLALKLQAEFCSFGDFKNMAIRDRIVAGINDKALQQRLLNEDKLTLDVAERIITTWQTAETNAKALGNRASNWEQIASLKTDSKPMGTAMRKLLSTYELANEGEHSRGPVKSRLGYKQRSGRQGYYQRQQHDWNKPRSSHAVDWRNQEQTRRSRFANFICDYCGVKAHIKKRCFKLMNLKKDAVNLVETLKPSTSGVELHDLINRMTTKDSDTEDEDIDEGESFSNVYECMNITSVNKINNPCLLDMDIEGKLLSMEIDCGSAVSVINKSQYFSIFNKSLQKCNKNLAVVNGSKLNVLGEVRVMVRFKGKEANLKLLVLNCENNFIPLLGRSWLDRLETIFFKFHGDKPDE